MICVSVNSDIICDFLVGRIITIFSGHMIKIKMLFPETTKFLFQEHCKNHYYVSTFLSCGFDSLLKHK